MKLDKYEQDIENNFSNQKSIGTSKELEGFKNAAIKHLKNKRAITNQNLEAVKIKALKL